MYYVLRFTWGIIQNVVGFCIFLANIGRRHFRYGNAVVTVWRSRRGSLGIGMFIFITEDAMTDERRDFTLMHEYGHTLQSIILGPLFLPIVGLPSLLWAGLPVFRKYREKNAVSYYSFYTERWANFLGERSAKNHEITLDKSGKV